MFRIALLQLVAEFVGALCIWWGVDAYHNKRYLSFGWWVMLSVMEITYVVVCTLKLIS